MDQTSDVCKDDTHMPVRSDDDGKHVDGTALGTALDEAEWAPDATPSWTPDKPPVVWEGSGGEPGDEFPPNPAEVSHLDIDPFVWLRPIGRPDDPNAFWTHVACFMACDACRHVTVCQQSVSTPRGTYGRSAPGSIAYATQVVNLDNCTRAGCGALARSVADGVLTFRRKKALIDKHNSENPAKPVTYYAAGLGVDLKAQADAAGVRLPEDVLAILSGCTAYAALHAQDGAHEPDVKVEDAPTGTGVAEVQMIKGSGFAMDSKGDIVREHEDMLPAPGDDTCAACHHPWSAGHKCGARVPVKDQRPVTAHDRGEERRAETALARSIRIAQSRASAISAQIAAKMSGS